MNPYLAIVSTRFRALLQYRAAALGGVITQTFFGLVRLMILEAFYRSSAVTPPLSLEQAVGYVWLGQAMLAMFPWNVDADIRELVRTGTVAYELCRPLDLYKVWFSRALAWRTAPMLLRFVPMFIIAAVALPAEMRLRPPATLAALGLWLVTVAGALMLSCALTTLMNISLLFTTDGQGIAVLLAALVTIFGGLIVPLPLYPEALQPLLRLLPFAGVMDLPARVYTGNIPAAQAGWVLLHQLTWTVALVWMGRRMLARGTRRLVVQGG